ncbi:ran guanine nucleotide release factor [Trifolium repens]|nr:ran guanine nucleotide release factor [Trifolium repens]
MGASLRIIGFHPLRLALTLFLSGGLRRSLSFPSFVVVAWRRSFGSIVFAGVQICFWWVVDGVVTEYTRLFFFLRFLLSTIASAKMSQEVVNQRPLFGGKISTVFPNRFQDVSNIREVPDHQEVFADPSRDESLIVELLEYKPDVADNGSAAWFLQDLANEQDAEGTVVIEQSGVLEAPGLMYNNIPAVITTAVGQMAISKGRQGREAQNIVKVYLANLRIKGVETDVLITAYEPIVINPFSESADTVGAGMAVPAAQAGCMSMDEVFKLAVTSFKVYDWSLFDASRP